MQWLVGEDVPSLRSMRWYSDPDDKVDAANARQVLLEAVANITASRVGTEKIRRCVAFNRDYVAVDYAASASISG